MGNFLDNMIRRPPKITLGTVFLLTPLGKTKAEAWPSGYSAPIMLMMLESGPTTLGEILNETGIPYDKTKAILKSLCNSGYARMSAVGEE